MDDGGDVDESDKNDSAHRQGGVDDGAGPEGGPLEVGDGFEAGVDGAADFGFALGLGREIAVVGVADEEILQS